MGRKGSRKALRWRFRLTKRIESLGRKDIHDKQYLLKFCVASTIVYYKYHGHICTKAIFIYLLVLGGVAGNFMYQFIVVLTLGLMQARNRGKKASVNGVAKRIMTPLAAKQNASEASSNTYI
jgi:hypothetical protein